MVVLEGSDLSMELVVEPPQCLLLTDSFSWSRVVALDHDLIGLVVPSSALSCWQVFEEAGLLATAVVRHW